MWENEIEETPNRNPYTGRFLKGRVPHNKGKKWSDFMGKRAQKRASKGWKNLEKFRPKGNNGVGVLCRKEIIAVMDDGQWRSFSHSALAAEWVNGSRSDVSRTCRNNEGTKSRSGKINTDHKHKGVRFYYDTNEIWMTKVRK